MKKDCKNCKYADISSSEEPCINCYIPPTYGEFSKWKAVDFVAGKDK